MQNIGNLLLILTGVTGILAFAGAALNGKRKDGYNAILKDSNDALREAADDKDKEIVTLQGRLRVAEASRDTLDAARKAAVDLAQSRPAFEQLGVQMMQQHQELLGAIGEQTKQLTNLATVITKDRAQ